MPELSYYHPNDIHAAEQSLIELGTYDAVLASAIEAIARALCAHYRTLSVMGVVHDAGKTGQRATLLAQQLESQGKKVYVISEERVQACLHSNIEIIIDGLSSPTSAAYSILKSLTIPIVALDCPGGIHPETGVLVGELVKVERTYAVFYPLLGLATGDGLAAAGIVQAYGAIQSTIEPAIEACSMASVLQRLSPRAPNTHKGNYGVVLVVAGESGYFGALLLAVRTLIAMGVGLIRVVTTPDHVHRIVDLHPHIIAISYRDRDQVAEAITASATICAGPGIEAASWFQELLPMLLAAHREVILDAGALRLIAQSAAQVDGMVLTPHPGEAAALLDCSAQDIQQHRWLSATTISVRYKAYCVLKGYGTIITPPEGGARVCPYGNSGMAVAGMGDVLAALIAGAIAQRGLQAEVVEDAVCLHAYIGDNLAQAQGGIGIEPADMIVAIKALLNQRVVDD